MLVLKDIRHVPYLHLNQISSGKLDDVGCNVNFDGGQLKLARDLLVVAKGSKCCALYKLHTKVTRHEVNVVDHNSSLAILALMLVS